jgi:hypothetical protein
MRPQPLGDGGTDGAVVFLLTGFKKRCVTRDWTMSSSISTMQARRCQTSRRKRDRRILAAASLIATHPIGWP